MDTFKSLGLSEDVLKVLEAKGFESPTPIQKKTIPAILQYIKQTAKTDIRKAELPKVKDVIQTKKRRIKNSVSEIIKTELRPAYFELANELLTDNSSEQVLAALL